jgi:hypothetical protein
MAAISGYQASKKQRELLAAHNGHELDIVIEPFDNLTIGCQTCHEILIEFYPEEEL